MSSPPSAFWPLPSCLEIIPSLSPSVSCNAEEVVKHHAGPTERGPGPGSAFLRSHVIRRATALPLLKLVLTPSPRVRKAPRRGAGRLGPRPVPVEEVAGQPRSARDQADLRARLDRWMRTRPTRAPMRPTTAGTRTRTSDRRRPGAVVRRTRNVRLVFVGLKRYEKGVTGSKIRDPNHSARRNEEILPLTPLVSSSVVTDYQNHRATSLSTARTPSRRRRSPRLILPHWPLLTPSSCSPLCW